MDYLVQAMDEADSMAEAMERIRSMRGVNYILQLDPLESGAIEHLALMEITPEMEG
jgi:recombinational DNA repair protein RecR